MAFRFRLQTLLQLREAARDERRGQLAEALRIDDALAAQLAEFEGYVAESRRLQTTRVGRIDVDRLLEAQRYEAVVTAEMRHVEQQRQSLAEEIERRRAALVEADREVKTLEKLRDARRAEYAAAEAREENKRLDEAAGRRRAEVVEL